MSNRNPRQSGITKYWRVGYDDRCVLQQVTRQPKERIDTFMDGLWAVISTQRRTRFVGFGVFEWKPYRRRLPTGRMVETWRLAFKPGRYLEKYNGGEE